MPTRRDRDRKSARPHPPREPRARFLIVCEGEKTEPDYIDGFRKACGIPKGLVKVVPHGGGSPASIVEHAVELKEAAARKAKRADDSTHDYNAVWCVHDVDNHDAVECRQAMEKAVKNGVDVAVSNPSFELWLYLHFKPSPGMQDRKWLQDRITRQVGKNGKAVDYDRHFAGGYQLAARRAEELDAAARKAGEPGRNPTTGVHRLTRAMEASSSKP